MTKTIPNYASTKNYLSVCVASMAADKADQHTLVKGRCAVNGKGLQIGIIMHARPFHIRYLLPSNVIQLIFLGAEAVSANEAFFTTSHRLCRISTPIARGRPAGDRENGASGGAVDSWQ